jgi:hypothetical protein
MEHVLRIARARGAEGLSEAAESTEIQSIQQEQLQTRYSKRLARGKKSLFTW